MSSIVNFVESIIHLVWFFGFFEKLFNSDPSGKPFVGEPSKTHQKNDLLKHMLSQIHGWSCHNEGVKSGRSAFQSSMDRFRKPILLDMEAIGGYIRLSYTMFRQEVPFSKHLFIHRAYVSWSGNEFLNRTGHFSHDCVRQTLRLISNHLWGFVDSFLALLRYIGIEIDDGTDCTQLSHLLLFGKFFWPAPSNSPPSGLPVLRSYETAPAPVVVLKDCASCDKKKVAKYAVCSSGHPACADCLKKKVICVQNLYFKKNFFF
jgi:hypothetical protein